MLGAGRHGEGLAALFSFHYHLNSFREVTRVELLGRDQRWQRQSSSTTACNRSAPWHSDMYGEHLCSKNLNVYRQFIKCTRNRHESAARVLPAASCFTCQHRRGQQHEQSTINVHHAPSIRSQCADNAIDNVYTKHTWFSTRRHEAARRPLHSQSFIYTVPTHPPPLGPCLVEGR